MDNRSMITGQSTAWYLVSKLGEGDAGEVYIVQALTDGKKAILKRPRKSAFQADILRQSSQIASEARILNSLKGFRVKLQAGYLTVPKLLDQAKPESENSADYFIVIEKAGGFDLDLLARLQRMQPQDFLAKSDAYSSKERHYLQHFAGQKMLPDYLFLRCMEALVALFEEIHHYPVELDGVEKGGVLWNDVKPDHIFWDPATSQCMIIDWGNAQFLEMDGTTHDRLFSASNDYLQFLEGMGKFLQRTYPSLFQQLGWPVNPVAAGDYIPEIQTIRAKIELYLTVHKEPLMQIRLHEKEIMQAQAAGIGQIQELEQVHAQILAYGEYPDYEAAVEMAGRLGKNLTEQCRLSEFRDLAEWAQTLPGGDDTLWRLMFRLGSLGAACAEEGQAAFLQAITEALDNHWGDILWHLLKETGSDAVPAWYPEVSKMLRIKQLEIAPDMPTPLEGITRFAQILDADLKPTPGTPAQMESSLFNSPVSFVGMNEKNHLMQAWLNRVRNEILPRWQQYEPYPPFSSLEYRDVLALANDIEAVYPSAGEHIRRSVYQADAQVRIILDAWDRKDFDFMGRAMRRLLLWDPERVRVLNAIEILEGINSWLDALASGPGQAENVSEYATRHEVNAREYRSRIGPASWLDRVLAVLKSLRQGATPAQAARENVETFRELFWLRDYIAQPSAPRKRPPARLRARDDAEIPDTASSYSLERKPKNNLAAQYFQGLKEARLGEDGDMLLNEPLDVWKPEAQGSSARVFQGFVRMGNDQLRQRAIKIMRPNQIDYALPLFEEEIRVLKIMRDTPGITPVFEFGFIKPDLGDLHPEDALLQPERLYGDLLRYGWDYSDEFLANLAPLTSQGWLPYLAMEKKNYEANLLLLCDAGHNQGTLMPVKLGLLAAIQICDILSEAHAHSILYRDHKILHYYWQQVYNGVFMIDWNVAKLSDRPLTESETQFDLVQFGARALHHILTGRPAPGALPAGPTRPDEIEQASHSYSVSWSFDDQRLSARTKRIIAKTLAGGYTRAKSLKNDLLEAFHETPDFDQHSDQSR